MSVGTPFFLNSIGGYIVEAFMAALLDGVHRGMHRGHLEVGSSKIETLHPNSFLFRLIGGHLREASVKEAETDKQLIPLMPGTFTSRGHLSAAIPPPRASRQTRAAELLPAKIDECDSAFE